MLENKVVLFFNSNLAGVAVVSFLAVLGLLADKVIGKIGLSNLGFFITDILTIKIIYFKSAYSFLQQNLKGFLISSINLQSPKMLERISMEFFYEKSINTFSILRRKD